MNKFFGIALALSINTGLMASTLASIVSVQTPIMGYTLSYEGLSLQVASGGCLRKDDFQVTVRETFPLQVSIKQISTDMCEAYLPFGTMITFSFEELGVKSGQTLKLNVPNQSTIRVPN